MSVLGDKSTWNVDNQEVRMSKGPLIRVQIKPGHWVKMYKRDAEERGYIPAEKSVQKPQDKMIEGPVYSKPEAPVANKAPETEKLYDDFTVIPNIGPATVRALNAHGITTYDQLKVAGKIEYISIRAMDSIDEWRKNV